MCKRWNNSRATTGKNRISVSIGLARREKLLYIGINIQIGRTIIFAGEINISDIFAHKATFYPYRMKYYPKYNTVLVINAIGEYVPAACLFHVNLSVSNIYHISILIY